MLNSDRADPLSSLPFRSPTSYGLGSASGSPSSDGFWTKLIRTFKEVTDVGLPPMTSYYNDSDDDDLREEEDQAFGPTVDNDGARRKGKTGEESPKLPRSRKNLIQKIGNNDILAQIGGEQVVISRGLTPLVRFCLMMEYQQRATGKFLLQVQASSLNPDEESQEEDEFDFPMGVEETGSDDDDDEDDDDEDYDLEGGGGSGPDESPSTPSSLESGRRRRRRVGSRVHPSVSTTSETTEVDPSQMEKTLGCDDGIPWHLVRDPAVIKFYYTWMALKTTDCTLMYKLNNLFGMGKNRGLSSPSSTPLEPETDGNSSRPLFRDGMDSARQPYVGQNEPTCPREPSSSSSVDDRSPTIEDVRSLMESWKRNFNVMYEHNVRLISLPSVCKQVVQSIYQWNNLHPDEINPPVPREQIHSLMEAINNIESMQNQFILDYTELIVPESRVVKE